MIPYFTPPAFFVKHFDPLRINFSTKKGYRPVRLRNFRENFDKKMMQTKFAKKGRRWYLQPKIRILLKKIVEHLVRKKGYYPLQLRNLRGFLLKNDEIWSVKAEIRV